MHIEGRLTEATYKHLSLSDYPCSPRPRGGFGGGAEGVAGPVGGVGARAGTFRKKGKGNQELPKRFARTKSQPRRHKNAIDEYEDGHDVYKDPTWEK